MWKNEPHVLGLIEFGHKAERVRNSRPASESDTIFAVSTGAGPAGVAVIRISGPSAADAFQLMRPGRAPEERRAALRTLFDKVTNQRIDDALILWFAAPRSYTGEDLLELHVHGGRAVISAVLAALGRLAGFRPAEPGEFTRRAVQNGRLDLTRAEAIGDLIAADTEAQRQLARRQYDGALADQYSRWRERLIKSAAWIEANLDFPDEELPEGVSEASRRELRALFAEMRSHLNNVRRGEIIRDGFHVAVIGPPNVGKSSLVNALARRNVAIVSDLPGTTRDIIEVKLDLGGYAVILADTAGLRESAEPIEREGIRRAKARAEMADFRLLVLDASVPAAATPAKADLVVWNKADLCLRKEPGRLYISCEWGEGIDALIDHIAAAAANCGDGREPPLLTRARHRYAVEEASQRIAAAIEERESELAAEQLRIALRALGRITGAVDLEELLDVVFRDFCIGK